MPFGWIVSTAGVGAAGCGPPVYMSRRCTWNTLVGLVVDNGVNAHPEEGREGLRFRPLYGHQQVLGGVHPEVTDLEPHVTDHPLLLLDPPQL